MKRKQFLLTLAATFLVGGAAHADLAELQKAGTIRIGVQQDAAPFAAVNRDMKLEGLEIDLAEMIGKKMGLKVQFVPVASVNRIIYLQSRKADLVISTLGKNAERAKVINFTQPYAPAQNAVLGIDGIEVKGPADLANQTIGVTRGAFDDLLLTPVVPATTTIKRYEDTANLVSAFVSGQVKLIAGNPFALQEVKNLKVKYVIQESQCVIGVNKEDTALLAKVNQVLTDAKKSGELNALTQKWLRIPLSAKIMDSLE